MTTSFNGYGTPPPAGDWEYEVDDNDITAHERYNERQQTERKAQS